MAKFTKAENIWALNQEEREALQPGQWVYAGHPSNKGRFLGVKPSGTVVVAWHDNAKGRGKGGYTSYISTLRRYAKGV